MPVPKAELNAKHFLTAYRKATYKLKKLLHIVSGLHRKTTILAVAE